MPNAALIIVTGLIAFVAVPLARPDSIVTRELKEVRGRTYVLCVPPDIKPDEKVPLVIALHGSGRGGRSIVGPWESLAKRERIIVAGPDAADPAAWHVPADGPDLLRVLVDEIAAQNSVDRTRVYLFGHSGGAIFALTMAVLESEYFAAVAIHAGMLGQGVTDDVLGEADLHRRSRSAVPARHRAQEPRQAGRGRVRGVLPRDPFTRSQLLRSLAADQRRGVAVPAGTPVVGRAEVHEAQLPVAAGSRHQAAVRNSRYAPALRAC